MLAGVRSGFSRFSREHWPLIPQEFQPFDGDIGVAVVGPRKERLSAILRLVFGLLLGFWRF
jgi:hypothetical protein